MALNDQVKNINPLTEVQFKFELTAYPATTFFVQTVNLPGLTMDVITYGRPQRTGLGLGGGGVEYELLEVGFVVDEYLKNWQEMFNWMTGPQPKYSSAILTILSSSMNPTIEAHFKELFPTSLTALDFDSTTADPAYQQASVTFKYTSYTIKSLLND